MEQLPLATYLEHLDAESAVYMSPQIEDLVGYTADEWVSDPQFFSKVLHADDRDWVLAGFAAAHATGVPFDGEYRVVARDGRVVWIHDAAVRVSDDAGRPLYVQGYMIDVTDRHQAEDALRESKAQLLRQMDEIEHQALHDSLTDLPNRSLFRDRIHQELRFAKRDGSRFAVMLVDLDRFKEVNDTLGHHHGDLLLQEVAHRLRGVLREGDTVARLGGDEFGILVPRVADALDAVRLADAFRDQLAGPIMVAGLALEVDSSVGIAMYPEHGDDVETLIRHADVAMYMAKATHSPAVYDAEHDHYSPARLTLVADLRRAFEQHELVVHYQVQADATTRQVRRVEALVRWQHPEYGLLGPDQFIPLAEHTGLIRLLTPYVLDTAIRQCSIWRREKADLGIAVNITGRDLLDLRFPDEVAGLLAKWGVDPSALELEITENTILTDPARARVVLDRLSELGVRLAVDDFGSGHSSLGYLKKLPIDVLKIDRSFVLNMDEDDDDAAIVRSTIDLGHNLGLEVVAEGVETEEAMQRLVALGCDSIQGYYLGRPEPTETLVEALGLAPRRAA